MNHAPTNMQYDHYQHHRQSIRLKGYDYSHSGAYFVTICTKYRECLFGDIVDGEMQMNDAGTMVQQWWYESVNKFKNIELDEFVVMPNHFHGIVAIVGAQFIAPQSIASGVVKPGVMNQKPGVMNHAPTVSGIVRAFKARCTHAINQIRDTSDDPVWQRNYYEHIIRNEQDLHRIRQYIIDNPMKWDDDEDNPGNITCRGAIHCAQGKTAGDQGAINRTLTRISCPPNP